MDFKTMMVPNNSQILPSIIQRRSSSLRDSSRVSINHHGDVQISEHHSHVLSRIENGKTLSNKTGKPKRFVPNFVETHASNDALPTRNLLPHLIDDHSFVRTSSNLDRQRSTFSSRSLETFSSRDLISEELRMRAVSLPILRNGRNDDIRSGTAIVDEDMTGSYTSYTDEGSSDEESQIVQIGPFPNVGTNSHLDTRLLSDVLKPWTPGVRKNTFKRHSRKEEAEKKRKELEALAAKEHKRKTQMKPRNQRRRSVRNDAFARKRESEAAKRHPVRKQFVYSELVQVELEKLTPKRIPGGKLKPIYNRRTEEGDIEIPADIRISLDSLSLKPGDERIDTSDSPAAINKRRKAELQALLERRKKNQRQMVHKKKRKVQFLLPVENHENDVPRGYTTGSMPKQNENMSVSSDQNNNSEDETEKVEDVQVKDADDVFQQVDYTSNSHDEVDEVQDFKIDRLHNWVANHTALLSPSNPIDIANGTENDAIATNQNLSGEPKEDICTNHTDRCNTQTNTDTVNNSSNQLSENNDDHATQDGSEQISQIGLTESGAVREIRFLSERIPSIVISDT